MQAAAGAGVAWQEAVEDAPGGLRLLLEVHPGSTRSAIEGFNAWRGRIVVAVRAPPRGGKANAEVLGLVARALRVEARAVRIAAGARGGHKTVEVAGIDRAEALAALGRLLSKA